MGDGYGYGAVTGRLDLGCRMKEWDGESWAMGVVDQSMMTMQRGQNGAGRRGFKESGRRAKHGLYDLSKQYKALRVPILTQE